jgi:hypothetical protein
MTQQKSSRKSSAKLFAEKPKPRTAEELIAEAAERADAKKDPKVHIDGAPLGYRLKGVSTLVKTADGGVQWVKTEKDAESVQAVLDAFRDAILMKPVLRVKPTKALKASAYDVERLAVYPMGDPHIGMLSWPEETGDDFNLQIAKAHLQEATERLVALAPNTETGVLINLGDFFHSDNYAGITARSGHPLDVDSRWPKMLRVGVWTLIHCVKLMLVKHKRVVVFNQPGNHDDHTAIMLALCLEAHFVNEPRVTIDTAPGMFRYHEFGQNLLGVTHGHTVKPDKLPGVMASDKPEQWGRTKFRYWYTGHVHHESKKEYPGCVVETFRTLAAKDAWHHAQGYRSGRSMVCDVLHKDFGRVLRHEVGVEQLHAK